MKRGGWSKQESVETPRQNRLNFSLRNTTLRSLLRVGLVIAAQQAAADPTASEHQRKNRSSFEYNDGRADERRPYRRPDLDVDPTNLKLEELRERTNALEERVERLEGLLNGSRKVR